MKTLLLVLPLVAIGAGLMMIFQDIPVVVSKVGVRKQLSKTYNVVEIDAPALAGPILNFVSDLGRTVFGPFIIRMFLLQNEIHILRQLAVELPYMPPTYYPVARLDAEEYDTHLEWSNETSISDILMKGLPKPAASFNTPYRTVMDYHRLYRSGEATPSMVMRKVLEGCEELKHLNIFSSLMPADVMKQAKAADERYRLGKPLSVFDGVPVAVKDFIFVHGHKNCRGSQWCLESDKEDSLVTTFRKAGAIILGLTVMAEAGVTPLGYNVWFDGPFNPYDPNYYPGGSSGGSAVAVAAGLVPVAIGFDGGGSNRVPASMTGTFGLATTWGRNQFDSATGSTVVKSGPIAATAEDTALAHVLMGQVVQKDHFFAKIYDGGIRGPPPPHLAGFTDSVRGMRLGIYWEHFQDSHPEVVRKCLEVVQFLKNQGAEIVNITIPHLRELQLAHGVKIYSEFALTWDAAYHNPSIQLQPNTEVTILTGKMVSAPDVLAGEKIRTWGIDLLRNKIFRDQRIDAIISPTLGDKVPKPLPGYRQTGEMNTPLFVKLMRYMPLANLLGLPGLSIPVGYEKDTGLPIGFQVMGDAWMEHKLLRIASAIETQFLERKAPSSRNYVDTLSEWLD